MNSTVTSKVRYVNAVVDRWHTDDIWTLYRELLTHGD